MAHLHPESLCGVSTMCSVFIRRPTAPRGQARAYARNHEAAASGLDQLCHLPQLSARQRAEFRRCALEMRRIAREKLLDSAR